MKRTTILSLLSLTLVASVSTESTAHAQDRYRAQNAGLWGAATWELSTAAGIAGLVTLTDENTSGTVSALMLASPVVLGLAAAGLAYRYPTDAAIPRAIHGGMWTGIDMMLIGMLIDGRNGEGMKFGTWALSLGAAGVVVGSVVGAREVAPGSESTAWFAGPSGVMAGFVFGGIAGLMYQRWSSDKRVRVLGWSMVTTLSIGLVASYTLALTGKSDSGSAASSSSALTITPSIGPRGLSFSGRF